MNYRNFIAGLIVFIMAGIQPCISQTTNSAEKNPAPDKLLVLKQGKTVLIRSSFSPTHDLVQRMTPGSNGQVSFRNAYLVERSKELSETELTPAACIHGSGDDSTPWHINGTYIGGNHGCSDARLVTIANHGKTTKDIGSAWRATNGVTFYLIKVVDNNRLWFLSENKGKEDLWKFVNVIPGTSLVNSADGTILGVTNQTMAQWNPACRIPQQDYLNEQGLPVAENAVTACRWLDIVDRYDIINPASALRQVISRPGREFDSNSPDLQAVIENEIRYRFRPDGSCVIHHKAVARQAFAMGSMGFIQTYKLNRESYNLHGYYIPESIPFTAYGVAFDFRSIQDFSAFPSNAIEWSALQGGMASPERYPDRFIQLLGRKDGERPTWEVGYVAGYSLIQGLSKPDIRFRQASRGFSIARTGKTYPVAIDKKMGAVIPAGTTFDCLAYRQYFYPDPRLKATCCYGNWQENDYVLYADYHRPVKHERLPVPKELAGQPVTVIYKTDSAVLNTGQVSEEGIDVSVNSEYGYLILRIAGKK